MVGAPDVVQSWMPRAARDSDACLWHVSVAGGARRRGCAAAGVPEFFNGPLGARSGALGLTAAGDVRRLLRAGRGRGLGVGEAQQGGGAEQAGGELRDRP